MWYLRYDYVVSHKGNFPKSIKLNALTENDAHEEAVKEWRIIKNEGGRKVVNPTLSFLSKMKIE